MSEPTEAVPEDETTEQAIERRVHDHCLGLRAEDVVACARDLMSNEGAPNPEYDDALVQGTAQLLGIGDLYSDDHEAVERYVLGREVRTRP